MKKIIALLFLVFLISPKNVYAVSQSDFPGALQGTIDFIGQNASDDFQTNVILPTYAADCWNDIGFTVTLYNAATGEAVANTINTHERHICGYLEGVYTKNWIVFPSATISDGSYWLYASSPSTGLTWVTDSISYNAPDITPTHTPTPTFTQSFVEIVVGSSIVNATVGNHFNVDVKLTDSTEAFNAAQANVVVSSNLNVVGLNYPTANSCNFNYTKRPTKNDPSFAGAIYGGSSTGCTVYTLTLKPTSAGTGTITFTDASVKAYANNAELLSGVQNGSYAIDVAPIILPTQSLSQLTVTSPLKTYLTNYTLSGNKDASITNVFINGSESGVTFPSSTTWEVLETLTLGDNNFTIYGSDGSNQTSTQIVAVKRHALGDINGDGAIDLLDASLFAVDWGKTTNLTYNLSDMSTPPDGDVDLTDLSILAKYIQ